MQAAEDVMVAGGISNLALTGLQEGDVVPRDGERISLTVRRVLKTRRSLLRT